MLGQSAHSWFNAEHKKNGLCCLQPPWWRTWATWMEGLACQLAWMHRVRPLKAEDGSPSRQGQNGELDRLKPDFHEPWRVRGHILGGSVGKRAPCEAWGAAILSHWLLRFWLFDYLLLTEQGSIVFVLFFSFVILTNKLAMLCCHQYS